MDWLENVYLFCALVGGTVLVVQTILLLVAGMDQGGDATDAGGDADAGVAHDATLDHHDVGHAQSHAAESLFLKWLSIKTVVAFLTFFGLAGLAGGRADWPPVVTLLVALGSGFAALFVVAWLMSSFSRLQSAGNVNLANAVGQTGKVYLRIPGSLGGAGKVTVEVQGRTVECRAITAAAEIPTGAPVRVVAVNGNLLEVAPLK